MFGIEQAFAATNDEVVAAGIIAGSVMTIYVLVLVLLILLIIARWKIFTKAGEAGWKSIIPIYSDYVQWRIAWRKTSMFWISLLLLIAGYVLMYSSGSYVVNSSGTMVATGGGNTLLSGVGALLVLAYAIISLVCIYKLMRAFGHGGGWTVLYILFPSIMLLVLGFGSSRYFGPQD